MKGTKIDQDVSDDGAGVLEDWRAESACVLSRED